MNCAGYIVARICKGRTEFLGRPVGSDPPFAPCGRVQWCADDSFTMGEGSMWTAKGHRARPVIYKTRVAAEHQAVMREGAGVVGIIK